MSLTKKLNLKDGMKGRVIGKPADIVKTILRKRGVTIAASGIVFPLAVIANGSKTVVMYLQEKTGLRGHQAVAGRHRLGVDEEVAVGFLPRAATAQSVSTRSLCTRGSSS